MGIILKLSFNVPLDKAKDCIPKDEHLKNIESIPLQEGAVRRQVSTIIEDNKLRGYNLDDWGEHFYVGRKIIPIEELAGYL